MYRNIKRHKGLELAKNGNVKELDPSIWLVKSETTSKQYMVRLTENGLACNCDYYRLNKKHCKHIWAVNYFDYWKNIDDFKKHKSNSQSSVGGDRNEPKRNKRTRNRKKLQNNKNEFRLEGSFSIRVRILPGKDEWT